MKNTITLLLSAAITVGPQFIPALPANYKDAATAALAFLSALYHLYQSSPNDKP
jgi:hypothetical protein